jgi:hypothetical protein
MMIEMKLRHGMMTKQKSRKHKLQIREEQNTQHYNYQCF